MKYKIAISLALLLLIPLAYISGYNLGALHERGLDAPSKAYLITIAVDLYEKNDQLTHMHMLSYINTELSFYEDYLDNGKPYIAKLTDHNYHIHKNDGYLQYIRDVINSSDASELRHKQFIIETLDSIKHKSHNKAPNLTGAENAPPS